MEKSPQEQAFVQCVIRYETILKAYARSILPHWEGVEEVLQNSYLIIWRKWEQLQQDSEFLPWSKTIVRFEALKYRRNKATDRHILDEDLLELIASEGEVPSELHSVEEEQKALQKCLKQLKPSHQKLVLAHYHEGNSLKALADTMSKSPNSLYKLMARLRQKLQTCIELQVNLGT